MGINNNIPCINCSSPTKCISSGGCIFDFVRFSLPNEFEEETDDGFSIIEDLPGDEIVKEY